MISSTVFPVISDGNFGAAVTEVLTVEVVPPVEATTRDDDVCPAVVPETEVAGAAEDEVVTPNAGAVLPDTAGVDEAGVEVLFEKEKPVVELAPPEEAVLLVRLKPVKDPPLPEDAAEAAAIDVVLAEELTPHAGVEVDWVVELDAGVETAEVVTVENSGAAEVANENEGVLVAGVLEIELPEAALPKPEED